MKIGVTVHFQHSYFSGGSAQTTIALADTLRLQGHTVHLIHVGDKDTVWWNDIHDMKKEWFVRHISVLEDSEYDLVFEVGRHMLDEKKRSCAKRCVWVCRKNPLLSDIEDSLFCMRDMGRSMEGISEVWVFSEQVTEDDVQYLEVQTRKPVRIVPYVWTPAPLEVHRAKEQSPVWQQVALIPEVKNKPYSIHICETNSSSASSCYIPLFISREAKKKWKDRINTDVKIHNAEHIQKADFFKDNVLSKAVDSDISGNFLGRIRCVDFVNNPKSIVIAHSRFLRFRPYILDCLWVGIPVVHNSELLSNRLGMSTGYYPNNDIVKGRDAVGRIMDQMANPNIEDLFEVRKKILEQFSPISPHIQSGFKKAVEELVKAKVEEKKPKPSNVLRVGFCDMWENFQPDYNAFVLMLRAATKKDVVGVDVKGMGEPVDVLVFGPFGDRWRSVDSSIPKVFFTGENTKPIVHPDVKLNLGFEHRDDPNYIRLPLWMLEINWFRADVNRLMNPKPVSIDSCCKVQDDLDLRKKFCAFVVSNPCNEIRNNSFHWLSKYKQVDSAGRLFNNVGSDIFAGLGGGGGELKKVEFLRQYKFALTFENASSPGYTTEKLFHGKVAGCVPIYWGDSEVEKDFDVRGFIDARNVKSEEELIALVKEVDMNDALWKEKTSVPALSEEGRDRVRRTLATVAKRILNLVGDFTVPEMIGYTSDRDELQEMIVEPASNTVFVTAANLRFLPSLQLFLQTLQTQKEGVKGLSVVVYLMKDVPKEAEDVFLKTFNFITTRRFPETGAYPDIWEPQHFAWKLYVLQEIVNDTQYNGRPIVYLDAGVVVARWPEKWIQMARDKGVVLLEDPRQENRRWCHMDMCQQMNVTEEEKDTQQIWAGGMVFIGGARPAQELFTEAWKWAQVRNVIVGAKWSGMDDKGRPMGHRHDQSILSVLSQRRGLTRMPLDDLYCDVSLRQTYLSERYLYVHRGNFTVHKPYVEGIDDVWVINLDRRKDRMERFLKTNTTVADRALRLSAFDGKTLPLTPKIARLFQPHDFNWKKSVMGCALSHLTMWMKILTDKPDIQSYLICEDDAVLDPSWKEKWNQMVQDNGLPDDWDMVYLGGILPPNRTAFEQMGVEKINNHVAKVKENTIFGQIKPNRYFHFCAYAYVLSRRGAQKIIDVLKAKNGYWTSADHMMCNIHEVMNIYFLHPLVAGCYQDNDPIYQQSQFNDFSRVDSFDSDLWNNKEQFSMEEVQGVMPKGSVDLDILGALEDARHKVEEVNVIGRESKEEATKELMEIQKKGRRFVTVDGTNIELKNLFEYEWLCELVGHEFTIESVNEPQDDVPVVVMLGHKCVQKTKKVLEEWKAKGKRFYLLHLSDEYGMDPVDDMYEWAEGVVRTYIREDVKESEKVKVIPLGYHWSSHKNPFELKQPSKRELVWSFVGTSWKGRKQKLQGLEHIPGEHKAVYMNEWNSPDSVSKKEMLDIMNNTLCVPCPVGNNKETYRLYEALEAGAVPIVVKEEGMEHMLEWLSPYMKVLPCENWQHAAQLIYTLKEKPEVYEGYRAQLIHGWIRIKKEMKEKVHEVFHLS